MSDDLNFNEKESDPNKRHYNLKSLNNYKVSLSSNLSEDFEKDLKILLNEVISQGYRVYSISKEKMEDVLQKTLSIEDFYNLLSASESYLLLMWEKFCLNNFLTSDNKQSLYSEKTFSILHKVAMERKNQDLIWNREPGNWNDNNLVKLSVLGEEFGEVCKSLLEKEQLYKLQQELVQVAAVAVAWAEDLESKLKNE